MSQQTCPFLIPDKLRCRGSIAKVIDTATGRKPEYQSLTPTEAKKCTDPQLFPKCPNFQANDKEICPDCGTYFLPEDGVQVNIGEETLLGCPNCGSTGKERE